jgi:branched-subunit amino acid transport protein
VKDTHTRAIFVLIVASSALALCGSLTQGHDWGGDFASYIMQAQSILQGTPDAFVEANRITVEQSSYPMGPIAYPWGFPLLLAPILALFGLNLLALKIVGALSYLLFLFVLWRAFRRVHTAPGFLFLVALFALNPTLLEFSDHILSDLPFLLISTLCIVLIQEVVVQKHRIFSQLLDLALIGAGIAFAFLIRTNGILLLITLGLSQLVSHCQKRSESRHLNATTEARRGSASESDPLRSITMKSVVVQVVPYIVFFTIAVWSLFLPDGGMSQASQVGSISAGMIVDHLRTYLVLPASFFTGVPFLLRLLVYGASIPLAIAGAARRYRSDYSAMIYAALTLLLYIFWPSVQGIRFLFPILPFYLSWAVSGLEALSDRGPAAVERRLWKALCYVPVSAVILFFGLSAGHAICRNIGNDEVLPGPFTTTSQELFSFLSSHTESDSTIIFFKPRVMRLMTGRQSVSVNATEQIFRGDYLCIYLRVDARSQLPASEVESLLAQGVTQLIYTNHDFAVYRLTRRPEELSPLPSSLRTCLRSTPSCAGWFGQSAGPPVSTCTASA